MSGGAAAGQMSEPSKDGVPPRFPGSLPVPEFIRRDWLAEQGVEDPDELLRAMRPEDEVMVPSALRSIKATRISFARTLIERMIAERWTVTPRLVEVDGDGAGLLFYDIDAGGHRLHFGVLAVASAGIERQGRLSDTEFDFYGTMVDGRLNPDRLRSELESLRDLLWSARTDELTLGFTIANRSVSNFDHVADALTAGKQPDPAKLSASGGYVIRNAGWYGNGRQGTRTWRSMGGHPLGYPFHPDMFALYLLRIASFDHIEATARARDPAAAQLDRALKRSLGVGNSSGMGMIAALVRWPEWLGAYHCVRELCLAHAVTRETSDPERAAHLGELLKRSSGYFASQPDGSVAGITPPGHLAACLHKLSQFALELARTGTIDGHAPHRPWLAMAQASRSLGDREACEQLHSLLIELYPDFAAFAAGLLPAAMSTPRTIDPTMTVAALAALLRRRYHWALSLDLGAPGARHYFWYRSEDSGENRRGERDVDAGVENETFVDVAGAVQALGHALKQSPQSERVGRFLLENPQHSQTIARAQLAGRMPYTEIRGNIIDRNFLPSDGIRFLLSTMGMEASRPKNERFVQGIFMQGVPLPDEIARGEVGEWLFPSPAPKPE